MRLGDPETQPLMHRMASDFVPALLAASEGELRRRQAGMARRTQRVRGAGVRRIPGRVRNAASAIRGIEAAEATAQRCFTREPEWERGI